MRPIRPLVGYQGSFAPWPGELTAGEKKAPDGCIAPSEGALMIGGRPESAAEIGAQLGVKRQLVNAWERGDRSPSAELRAVMAERFGIPVEAWSAWRPKAGATPPPVAVEAPKAAASKRERDPVELDPDDEFPKAEGDVSERATALLHWLAKKGRGPDAIAQAREIRQALALHARVTGEMMAASKAKLHEHPDFPAFLDRIMTGIASVPGALDALAAALDVES